MNIVKCLQCKMVLESRHRHDFQQCECANKTFCDGGNAYQRIGGLDTNLIEVIKSPIEAVGDYEFEQDKKCNEDRF